MLGLFNMTLDELSTLNWGEFCAWLEGASRRDFGMEAQLLRTIAFQQLTLNPYVDKTDKPFSVVDYIRFPTDEKKRVEKTVELNTLLKRWKVEEH